MSPGAKWCAACGQKTYKGPPSFWQLLGEFFDTIFSLDNRLFRTLTNLVVPGRLTNHFLAGKQKPYFHPLRLFFVSGVIMVAAYSLHMSNELGDSIDRDLESRRAQAYQNRFGEELRVGVDSIKVSFSGDTSVAVASDSLLSLLGHSAVANPDSFFIDLMEYDEGLNFKGNQIQISYDDFQLLSPAELADEYEIEGTLRRYLFNQVARFMSIDLAGVTALTSQIIWGLLLLVPLAALMLKLFYIRRKRPYVEHFIFTLHTHAFIFLTQFLAALGLLIFDSPWLLLLSVLAAIIYALFALKRVYKQSWGKTVLKAMLMGWGYIWLFTLAFSITASLAFLVF